MVWFLSLSRIITLELRYQSVNMAGFAKCGELPMLSVKEISPRSLILLIALIYSTNVRRLGNMAIQVS